MNAITSPSLIPDLDAARRLFEAIDQIHLVSIDPEGRDPTEGKDFGVDVEAAIDWATAENGKGRNVYWTVNRARDGVHKKPKKADLVAARFAHLDIDPPKNGTPWDRAGALAGLQALNPQPSMIIDSGNGLQSFWRLDDGVAPLDIEAINTGLIAKQKGDLGTHNCDRLMRVPGFVNFPSPEKRAKGRVPVLSGWVLPDTGELFTLAELGAAFTPQPALGDGQNKPRIAKGSGKPSPIEQFNAENTISALLLKYGYTRKEGSNDYRSTHQTSGSYATKDFDDHWVSWSSSDLEAGLGRACKGGGCFGDAFDLFMHYEHGGDRKAALAALGGGNDGDVPDQIPGSTDDAGNPPPSAENLHPYLRFEIPETDTFMAPEFVLDGIMIAGSVILAGGWGVGKTSQLVPLLFRAAHLCAPDDPLRPLLRRRVVYISEDVEQVRQIVRSMRAAGELDGISKEEVEDYFKVVSAVRMKPEEIIKVAKPYAGLVVTNNSPATGVSREAHALVVFDTRSACIDLDDESDNTEAGRVMATLRQGFPDNPQLIVGHIAKALKKADAGDLSGRGAGAWEADAQQVLYLVEKDGERWLDVAGPKHRFVASVDGIAFETVRSETSAIDPLGRSVTMQLVHGKPRKVQLGQRAVDKARLAEESEREAHNATRAEVLTLARELHEAGAGCNRARLKKDIKRQSKVVVEMIDELLDESWLLEMPIEASVRRHPRNAHYLFPPSPSERDAYLKTGVLPPAAHQPPHGFVKPA
jgi:hypothetical protein